MKYISVLLILSAALFVACNKDEDPGPEEETACTDFDETYNSAIKAIIDSNCAVSGCHNGTNPRPDYTDYSGVFEDRNAIRSRVLAGTMPPPSRGTLSQQLIDQIDCWVQAGAPE